MPSPRLPFVCDPWSNSQAKAWLLSKLFATRPLIETTFGTMIEDCKLHMAVISWASRNFQEVFNDI